MNHEAEMYFIQFLYMENRDLLRYEFKELYGVLFERYTKVYEEGRAAKVDLFDINKKFKETL